MKKRYDEIPLEQIPEGIELCVKNAERHMADSQMLEDNQRYQTAVFLFLLAIEELAKANLLLKHYKKGEAIVKNLVRDYFRDHKLRLKEFFKSFHARFESIFPPESLDKLSKSQGDFEQYYKEKMLYVDWLGYCWHFPLTYSDFALDNTPESINNSLKSKLDLLKLQVGLILNYLKSDPDYIRAISTPKKDNPSKEKFADLVKEIFGKSIPYNIEFTPAHRKIVIKITAPKFEDNIKRKKQLQEKLEERFHGFKAIIELIQC